MQILVMLVLVSTFSNWALAQKGVVSHRIRGCDYFLIYIERSSDYVLAEWYGGYDPEKGDVVYGSFSPYGFKDVNYANDREGRLWIEDYALRRDRALEKLYEKCD